MVPFSFGGHEWRALPQGALYWPSRRALLVADLHFEKASWYAIGGQMLPPYDTLATLADLAALVAAAGAREIWCLGDSFHDAAGCERLPERARAILRELTAGARWTWITGNHDPVLVDRCGGAVMDEAAVDGVVLRHEARADELQPELSGHFHPKLRVRVRGRLVQRRCFIATQAGATRVRRADRRARRRAPGDRPRGRHHGGGAGAGRGPDAAVPAGGVRTLRGRLSTPFVLSLSEHRPSALRSPALR